MDEKWDDTRDAYIADYVHGVCRSLERIAQPPSLTPAQRRVLAREAEADDVKLDRIGLAQLKRRVAEQDKHLDMLHDLIEQQQTGARHLAGRLDALGRLLDSQAKAHGVRFERLDNYQTRINRLEAFRARVLAGFPSIGEAEIEMGTTEEQIADIWPETEEGDGG